MTEEFLSSILLRIQKQSAPQRLPESIEEYPEDAGLDEEKDVTKLAPLENSVKQVLETSDK